MQEVYYLHPHLLHFTVAAFAVMPLCLGQAPCQAMNWLPPPIKLIMVRTTIRNISGKPLEGVALIARNQSGTVGDKPVPYFPPRRASISSLWKLMAMCARQHKKFMPSTMQT